MQDTNLKLPETLLSLALLACLAGCGSEEPDPTASGPAAAPVGRDQPVELPNRPEAPTQDVEPVVPDAVSTLPDLNDRPMVVYRPSWPRPNIADEELRRVGLVRHTTPLLDLITDIGPEKTQPLLPLIEQLHRYHESYFGELPPARDGSDYRITGYVMRDQELFAQAKLLPNGGLLAFHGRQIGPQFWMNDQPWDYYRRHLLMHEATHAFMRHIPGYAEDLPLWYLEGMAELLATHTIDDQGTVTFNVMPVVPGEFLGHERIAIVRNDLQKNGLRSIEQITSFQAADFHKVEAYAWCWALCRFLDSHPNYQKRFRSIARELITQPFNENLAAQIQPDNDRLRVDWAAFASGIEYGYDFERTVLAFPGGQPAASAVTVEVMSDRGWQSSDITLTQGQSCEVFTVGRFTLASDPKPWVSEANGVSIRFYDGQPLGRLLAMVISYESGRVTMSPPIPLGNRSSLTAPISGTLYLRLNDHWGELSDNTASIQVTVQPTGR